MLQKEEYIYQETVEVEREQVTMLIMTDFFDVYWPTAIVIPEPGVKRDTTSTLLSDTQIFFLESNSYSDSLHKIMSPQMQKNYDLFVNG